MISKRTMIIQSLELFSGFWIVLIVPEENQLFDGFLVKKSWCGVLILNIGWKNKSLLRKR